MEEEIKTLIKVWICIFASLTYIYFISKNIPKGFMRLLSILPIIFIFLLLPLSLSSVHLGGTTAFFIAWLANFKLLLFSFNEGPLSSNPSLSFKQFISISCFPIKIKQNPSPQFTKSSQNSSSNHKQNPSISPTIESKSLFNYVIKALLIALLVQVYEFKQYLNPNFILFLYCFHLYFGLELTLAMTAKLVRFLIGLELEPQFNDPYFSTSLQDFWGKRWNLMVTSILRLTVYVPTRRICTRIFGKQWALLLAILATFGVSGLMHELMFFYLGRVRPTWQVMWFFAIHGVCLAIEIKVKKALSGRYRLHPVLSGPLTVGFVMVTGFWLFFPQLVQCGADVRAIQEYTIVWEFVKDVVAKILITPKGG